MALVPGASRFLNQATLAALQGSTFQQSNVLGESTSGISLLDVGRRLGGNNGIGLSNRARTLNKLFLQQNQSTFNQLFSLTGGSSATVDASLIQIKGLQATVPASRNVSTVIEDDGGISASDTGTTLDETV